MDTSLRPTDGCQSMSSFDEGSLSYQDIGYRRNGASHDRNVSSDVGNGFGSVRGDDREAEIRMHNHANRKRGQQSNSATPLVSNESRASTFFSPSDSLSPVDSRSFEGGRYSDHI